MGTWSSVEKARRGDEGGGKRSRERTRKGALGPVLRSRKGGELNLPGAGILPDEMAGRQSCKQGHA